MADRIIKPDSGNDVVIQNNGGTRKIEVTNSGDVEVTGDFKATTVKATNLKANDGTASLEVADSTGDIGFSGNTNLKIKLPSAGGIYESDGSTEVLTESSGTATLKNTVIDGTVSMASSGLTVRNIEQVALGSNQSLHSSSTITTFFSPTYTPKFSGSKVQGNLTMIVACVGNNLHSARKRLDLSYEGSDITNITFGGLSETIGGYDYGGSGVIIYYAHTTMGPLLTTSGTSQITCNCKLANSQASGSSEWQVYADNTLKSTHFTWIEYK